ncbi:MAG: methionine--tRNA ligase [Proteobacteria bacterium]|nr:methionine--tRNA ligase [Pseudomonadota bacterium]
MSSRYYITTPIYYVTDAPHIGHLYTTVAADIMAQYQKMNGKEVWFLTGTDEHGQKIQKKAKETDETPQALADRVVQRYQEAWKLYGIQYNDFIRTTEDRHKKVVQHFIKKLMDTGDIYLDHYEGLYCIPCEAYCTETQATDGKCPDCNRPVETLREESYFFKMSKYADALLKHIESHPNFILPEARKNEVLGFLKGGVKDISISRTTIDWGIPMPSDAKANKGHFVYVWFDALTNYISALGPSLDKDDKDDKDNKFEKFWPEAIHIVGKDILRFHAVYWPTFLMALNFPLPKQIVAHGWLTDANRKISKSLGNSIDPIALAKEVGVDGMRYFLFREFVFGLDGEYTKEVMYQRINSDLANDFGNCINRVSTMIPKYMGDNAISVTDYLNHPSELKILAADLIPLAIKEMDSFHFHKALENVLKLVSGVNRYIENSAPWTLAKSSDPKDKNKLEQVLIHCHESLRIASLFLVPFIPKSAQKALEYLGDTESYLTPAPLLNHLAWGTGPQIIKVTKSAPLFPRLELPKA